VTTPRGVRLALTVGDPAGIGPEIVIAALRQLPAGVEHVRVYGDAAALERCATRPADLRGNALEIIDTATAKVAPGEPDPAAAHGVVHAVRGAALACLDGTVDALVTGPLSKEMLGLAGYTIPGHTELLEEVAGTGRAVMLLAGGRLRVVPATIHCALREVSDRLSVSGLSELIAIVGAELRSRFGLAEPRIAVCGLNPHASDGGRFGDEEARIIRPAIEAACSRGFDARGPLAADSLFSRAVAGEFDVVIGMYHDQVLGPLKLHAFGQAVNVTLGLPLIRTSVDHGTAFDIAGSGSADPGSMHAAVRLAVELAAHELRAGVGAEGGTEA